MSIVIQKFLLFLFLFFAFSCFHTSFAQIHANMPSEERAAKLSKMMKEELALTQNQIPNIEVLNLRYALRMEEVKKGSDWQLTKLNKAKAIDKEKDKELKALLTEDQFKKYQKLKQELIQKMKSS